MNSVDSDPHRSQLWENIWIRIQEVKIDENWKYAITYTKSPSKLCSTRICLSDQFFTPWIRIRIWIQIRTLAAYWHHCNFVLKYFFITTVSHELFTASSCNNPWIWDATTCLGNEYFVVFNRALHSFAIARVQKLNSPQNPLWKYPPKLTITGNLF